MVNFPSAPQIIIKKENSFQTQAYNKYLYWKRKRIISTSQNLPNILNRRADSRGGEYNLRIDFTN